MMRITLLVQNAQSSARLEHVPTTMMRLYREATAVSVSGDSLRRYYTNLHSTVLLL